MFQSDSAQNKSFLMKRIVNLKYKNRTAMTEHTSTFHNYVNQFQTTDMQLNDQLQAVLLFTTLPYD